ncbi:MAG: DNA-binding protein, partial [Verrucomicrobiaceae bacterium]
MAKRPRQSSLKQISSPTEPKAISTRKRRITQSPLQRMLFIHNLLQSEAYPNCTRLKVDLECHTSSIRRDIEVMRNSLGLPVGYDQRRHGYYYMEPVKQFPTVKLTSGELVALCVAQQLLEAHRGSPFELHLRSAFEKITHSMQDQITFRLNDLASAFSIRTNGHEAAIDLEALSRLGVAALECREVEFSYVKLGAKRPEQRRVHPMHLTSLEG